MSFGTTGLWQQILDGSPVPTFAIDRSHRIIHWNPALEAVSGVSADQMLGTNEPWKPFYDHPRPTMADLIVDQRIQRLDEFYAGKYHPSPVISGAWEAEDFFEHFPGGGRWLAFTAIALHGADGEIVGAIETLRDVTDTKRSVESLNRTRHLLTSVIDACPVPLFVLDADHKVTHWNRACEAIVGGSKHEIIGSDRQWEPFYGRPRPVLADLILDSDDRAIDTYYQGKWSPSPLIPEAWEATDYFPNFTTGPKWLYFTAAPIRDGSGQICGAVETLQDISAQKGYESRLEHQASHDDLTGLPNRGLFYDRLEQAIAHARRHRQILAILFVDLDNFKTVNDTLGHSAGDDLIKLAASRIEACTRRGDTVARQGGDEFVVLLFGPESEGHVIDVLNRITEEMAEPANINGQDVHTGCSIGVAIYPRDGADPETLLKHADAAMYQAKRGAKGGFSFFTRDLNREAENRLKTEGDLHGAIERGEFELHYQPILSVADQSITGAEALLRWRHPEKGLVMPDAFISIAEDTGLIGPIGEWVLRAAVEEAKSWRDDPTLGRFPVRLSVNVSARQFQDRGLQRLLDDLSSKVDLSTLDIEIELTENIVMQNPKKAALLLRELRTFGVRLAMDDFGTGYSSLAYLRRYPFDMVKIDKSFITDLGESREAEAIVRAVLDLGHALGLLVVAEGVETESQLAFLANEGCDEVQGYLFAKPQPADVFRNLIGKPLST
ncbi:MAG: EAL domain-containing protein [Magnetovibrionaceae bacterium]